MEKKVTPTPMEIGIVIVLILGILALIAWAIIALFQWIF